MKDCIVTDARRISNICHRVIYGRANGFTLPSPQFVIRLGLIYGDRVEGFGNPQSDAKIIREIGRPHLSETDIISYFRRGNSSMDSLAQCLAKIPALFRGL